MPARSYHYNSKNSMAGGGGGGGGGWSADFPVAAVVVDPQLRGDKMDLPVAALQGLLDLHPEQQQQQQSLPQPLMFRVQHQHPQSQPQTREAKERIAVHAGVRQFDAPEGQVRVSPYLARALGIISQDKNGGESEGATNGKTDPDDRATAENGYDNGPSSYHPAVLNIREAQLPKGTYARFRPLEAGYDPDDWKPLLERQLNEYTTLTRGAEISVRSTGGGGGAGGESFRLLVDKLLPSSDGGGGEDEEGDDDRDAADNGGGDGICVIDTDLAIDIEALNEEQARETMSRIMAKVHKTPATTRKGGGGGEGGSSAGQELDIWNPVEGQVVPGEYVDYELRAWPRDQALEIELGGFADGNGDEDEDGVWVDLFVSPKSTRQRARPRSDEHVFGVWECQEGEGARRKVVRLRSSNVELDDAESLMISVGGYKPPSPGHGDTDGGGVDTAPRPFRIRVRSTPNDVEMTDGAETDETTGRSPDEEQCANCRNWIPKRTMMLHENFCRRNNASCEQCGRVFQRSSQAWTEHWHCPYGDGAAGISASSRFKHDHIFHDDEEKNCPAASTTTATATVSCSFKTNSLRDLARHRTTMCPGKLILCRFCHLEVPQEGGDAREGDPSSEAALLWSSGLTPHEFADGGRTTECHRCGGIVKLRDVDTHMAWHDRTKADRAAPRLCRNANCGRTAFGVGKKGVVHDGPGANGNTNNNSSATTNTTTTNLGLCESCFAPLFAQGHDPEGKAVRRRVERRYLTQMSRGCGKAWCGNVGWCRTGHANSGDSSGKPMPTNLKDLVPIVRPQLDGLFPAGDSWEKQQTPLFFCVDETNSRRRALAELLAGEGKWALEWCVAACEAEGPDEARARAWLEDWAPGL